ncbi:uncharacterized protein LOC129710923 [Leucoraja erinacea]|uniref:uncharacterized protein LOC129710923 n=1 Tax=Leucoraja erinaceus TaxID=7782 RepID=UPI00245712EB|nr:uncharacterized protein LOC129710923 [Leucoraja erinacea]
MAPRGIAVSELRKEGRIGKPGLASPARANHPSVRPRQMPPPPTRAAAAVAAGAALLHGLPLPRGDSETSAAPRAPTGTAAPGRLRNQRRPTGSHWYCSPGETPKPAPPHWAPTGTAAPPAPPHWAPTGTAAPPAPPHGAPTGTAAPGRLPNQRRPMGSHWYCSPAGAAPLGSHRYCSPGETPKPAPPHWAPHGTAAPERLPNQRCTPGFLVRGRSPAPPSSAGSQRHCSPDERRQNQRRRSAPSITAATAWTPKPAPPSRAPSVAAAWSRPLVTAARQRSPTGLLLALQPGAARQRWHRPSGLTAPLQPRGGESETSAVPRAASVTAAWSRPPAPPTGPVVLVQPGAARQRRPPGQSC